MDTKKFVLLVSALTAVICALTVVYNFASMPAYGDNSASAVALYSSKPASYSTSGDSVSGDYDSGVSGAGDAAAAADDADDGGGGGYKGNGSGGKAQKNKGAKGRKSTAKKTVTASVKPAKTAAPKNASSKTATTQSPVNINSASLSQLESVPYIGATKAAAIIDYRNAHGAFNSISELDSVKGFGAKMLAKVSPYLTV